ncbi:MAG: hypothetical protein JSW18_02130 [Candidatus Omnitrophota bacterium]|nr:MAG: hypothetical protein JSW18_02130 [Candidatus Omnitrophota bacterium]
MIFEFFRFDNLSNFVGIFIGFFSLLILLYSFGFMRKKKGLIRYYSYIILTLVASLGVVFSNNLILFVVFWGFLALLLYLLIGFGEKKHTSYTAKKSFIIIGGTDALILLGLAFVWRVTGSLQMDKISIAFDTKLAIWAYLCFAAGAFAKAGAIPFHTWVPDVASDAPVPVVAFLPASLDKLLGIYFLARITMDMFVINLSMNIFLMALGSFTIIAAVMMALVQHDLKRLLGYHAVSQVGYMVLGIGTGNPIGIAGGLFHMLNNAIYKSCLFLSGGAAEKRANTSDLEKLGGLSKFMPVSFAAFLIASLAISGVPPLNGFFSKWMIYQGVIETAKSGSRIWIIWLISAMFGSALTLASFMKATHSVFLGQPAKDRKGVKEVGFSMWAPSVILAGLCIIFGVFAYRIPIGLFIGPSVKGEIAYTGIWNVNLATLLILVGIVIGGIIYMLGNISKNLRVTDAFVGGELIKEHPDMRVSGTGFYNTIKDIPILNGIYKLAQERAFDIYEQLKKFCLFFTKILRLFHTGILTTYLIWMLLGALILFFILMR